MLEHAVAYLAENPILLLFVVAGIGYPLGRLRIAGCSLGIAAVLFVGLGVGALHPDLRLPEVVYLLGLTVFVYTIGLSSGPSFVRSLNRRGIAANLLTVGVLMAAAALVVAAPALLGLSGPVAVGAFTGSLTNTPALAAVLETLKDSPNANDPVVGYSITYPIGVLGVILVVSLFRSAHVRRHGPEVEEAAPNLVLRAAGVSNPEVFGKTIAQVSAEHQCKVVFGRLQRGDRTAIATGDHILQEGDLLSVLGTEEDTENAIRILGEPVSTEFLLDRSFVDYRRIFVSSPETAGKRLGDLQLPQRMNAIVTRVRRGDVDFLPTADTVLELGDRVRVLTERTNMDAVSRFFGDSYRALSEIDILSFGLGLALGLVLGSLPIPIGGGLTFKLGFAGGPLVVALALSALHRTGPIVWQIPYSANLTLRQIGLVLFLAAVGTRSGYAFFETMRQGEGWTVLAFGAFVTLSTATLFLWIGSRVLRVPQSTLFGMMAAVQTQPAVLAFAQEQTKSDRPNVGYATVYASATLTKIVLAQVLAALLR
ncbi:MAG: transporter [Fimbriimonadia bacterium]|jgi:putative transport protein